MSVKNQIIWMAIIGLALVACTPRTSDVAAQALDPVVYIDSATGCNYLSTSQINALTPRTSADGHTHMGCKDGAK